MSVDASAESHEQVEDAIVSVTERRLRRVVYAVMGVNTILMGTLLGIYLFLRSSLPDRHWQSVVGLYFGGFTRAEDIWLIRHKTPFRLPESPVSRGTLLAIVGMVALSALAILVGENRLHLKRARTSKFIPFAYVASAIAAVALYMTVKMLRGIPIYFEVVHGVHIFVHTDYGELMVTFCVLLIVNLGILILSGIALGVGATRGRISRERSFPVHYARVLWVYVVAMAAVGGIVTQLFR